MSKIDINDIDKLLENMLKASPEIRRKAIERAASNLHADVRSEIRSRINDSHGKVQRWQRIRKGSKGGYAVIEPENSSTGDNSPGAITNYLEHGHRIRPPKRAGAKGYRPRIRESYVDGRYFYDDVGSTAEHEAIRVGKEICEKMAKVIEKGGSR